MVENVFKAKNYDSAERFGVYQAQAHYIETMPVKDIVSNNILEFSTGSGFMKRYLESKGLSVFSVDVSPELKPDLVHDLSKPFDLKKSFGLVLCFQVLEHIKEEDLPVTLASIKKHSGFCVISVPIQSWFFKCVIKFPLLKHEKGFVLFKEKRGACVPYRKWMLGDKEHSIDWFKGMLNGNGFKIIKAELPYYDPLHYYFTCEVTE